MCTGTGEVVQKGQSWTVEQDDNNRNEEEEAAGSDAEPGAEPEAMNVDEVTRRFCTRRRRAWCWNFYIVSDVALLACGRRSGRKKGVS